MRKFLAIAALAAAPLCCLLFPFACGFFNFDQVALMLMAPIMLCAPPLATVLFAWIVRLNSFSKSVAICVGLYAGLCSMDGRRNNDEGLGFKTDLLSVANFADPVLQI